MRLHTSQNERETRNVAGHSASKHHNDIFFKEAANRKAVQFMKRGPVQKQNEAHPAHTHTTRFIVPDATAPRQGQIGYAAFLSVLHHKVSTMADGILSKVGESSADCPYIAYWFSYYASKDAVHIEESIARYAPETNSAKDWESYTNALVEKVTLSFNNYVSTGVVGGMPGEIPQDLHEKEAQTKSVVQKKDIVQMCDCGTAEDDSEETLFSKLPDEDVQHIIGDGQALGGNLKTIRKVSGTRDYIVAGDAVKEGAVGLAKEVELLMELRKQGLDVPNVYTHPDLQPNAGTGISQVKGKPAFIADYIDGEMIDIWKIQGRIRTGISTYLDAVSPDVLQGIAQKIKTGLGVIVNYLDKNIIVDLQVIIERNTGRVVVIDPLAIYPVNAPNIEDKLENHGRVKHEIRDGILFVDTCVQRIIHGPDEQALTKEALIALYEKSNMDNATFYQNLVTLLIQLKIPANKVNLKKYMEISECLDKEEIDMVLG